MKRELRVKELKMLDEARQRFMHHHQQVKEAELKRLDDEVKRKVCMLVRSSVSVLHKNILIYVILCMHGI